MQRRGLAFFAHKLAHQLHVITLLCLLIYLVENVLLLRQCLAEGLLEQIFLTRLSLLCLQSHDAR